MEPQSYEFTIAPLLLTTIMNFSGYPNTSGSDAKKGVPSASRRGALMNTSIKSTQIRSSIIAAALFVPLCVGLLAPTQPAHAQTCMTESLLYTYEDEAPATKSTPVRNRKSVQKFAAKVAVKKQSVVKAQIASRESTQEATHINSAIHISENSITTMRNHP